MKRNLRIVFMGTPGFAVPSLDAIINAGFEVVGVITAPDKPAGRGQRLKYSAVKEYCLSKGLNTLQPEKLRSPDFLEKLKTLKANLFVVIAFRMLPEVVWSIPEYGTINLHASMLPEYRGATPINHVIINGEEHTGVTTFFINDKIDTGNIIFQEKTTISKSETAGELHDRLMISGANLVIKTIKAIKSNTYTSREQSYLHPNKNIKQAPKIFKADCKIDWSNDVEQIYNFIRGLSPYPGAYSDLNHKDGNHIQIKVFRARYQRIHHNRQIGTIITDNKSILSVMAKNGKIYIDELQISGKKRLKVEEFLNGFEFKNGSRFEN